MMGAATGKAVGDVNLSSVAISRGMGSWRGNENGGSGSIRPCFGWFFGAATGVAVGEPSAPGNVVIDVGEAAGRACFWFFVLLFLDLGFLDVSHLGF